MIARALPLLILTVLCAPPSSIAQSPKASDTNDRSVIHATSREVLLDLVVRDKHHHTLPDLRPEEVEVYEDGVRQNVRVFRNVQGAEQLETERTLTHRDTSPADRSQKAPTLNSLREINFVSVVFADIAPLNLEFARQSVLEFLKHDNFPNTYVTIYRLNRKLQIVQGYTADKDALVKAVNAAAKGFSANQGMGLAASVGSGANAAVQANVANVVASPLTSPGTAIAAESRALDPMPSIVIDPLWARNAASQDATLVLGNALLTQIHMETGLRFAQSLANGMEALDSLHQLVHSQEKIPGRKVVLYLSDGLPFPVNRRDAIDNLVGYANRVGVSFYTIDTRGLNTEDSMLKPLAAMERAGAESLATRPDPASGHEEDDDIQLTAVANTQENMRDLAEATGGFAVTNTNEIAAPMQRMMEDIRTHYELAYTPTSTNYDGHFRKIEVKISRPKVTVQTRKGYFALPELNGEPLQPFELAALNAINARPSPAEFPFRFALMKFRPTPEAVEYEVAFEVPIAGLKAVTNPKTGKARVQTSLVALIHDVKGDIVGKVSRDVSREISATELGKPGNDRILYAEPVELPKGHYVVDTAVTDEQSGKSTVKRIAVYVDPGKNLGMSSLQMVRQLQATTGPRNPLDPFQVEDKRVIPTLENSVGSSQPVDLYFVLYPAEAGTGHDLKATLQMFREGKEVARKPLDLSKPDVDGSIPMLVRLSPDPGQCDVVITARQGDLVAQSSLSVKVE